MLAYNVLTATGTSSYFFPTLMSSLGYTGNMVQCESEFPTPRRDVLLSRATVMTAPIYCVAIVISMAMNYSADITNKKAYHVIAISFLGFISFLICTVVHDPKVRYAFICFGAGGVWSAIPLFLSWYITMFEGREKRAISIALINGLGEFSVDHHSSRL